LGQPIATLSALQQESTLALQRARFDKAAGLALQPHLIWLGRHLWHSELAVAVLDAERTPLLPTNVVILPAPYLDLDPAFLLTRWAAEVNTSRRSDHDARFKVLWGPLAAAVGSHTPTTPWPRLAGPATTALLGPKQRLSMTWLLGADAGRVLAANVADHTNLSPVAIEKSTGQDLVAMLAPCSRNTGARASNL